MEERIEQHLGVPGLLVLDITAADEPTAQAAMTELDALWMTSGAARVQRVPGEPGVRARVYAALRRPSCLEDTAQVGPEPEAKFGFGTADVARLHAGHERLNGLFPSDR